MVSNRDNYDALHFNGVNQTEWKAVQQYPSEI